MTDETMRDVVVLAGGVGAARFLEGVVQAVAPERVTAIVNTGDDTEFYGLTVSPDVDIVLYTLAGIVEPSQGWGVRGDSYAVLEMLERLGRERWFLLGDRDLAVHIHRTELLRQGQTPLRGHGRPAPAARPRRAGAADERSAGPYDNPDARWLAAASRSISCTGGPRTRCWRSATTASETAPPAPGLLEAINAASAILISPSNPLVSVGTILALPGVRDALQADAAPDRRGQPDRRRGDHQGTGRPDDARPRDGGLGGRRGPARTPTSWTCW